MTVNPVSVKPFLKFAGGKTRLLPELVKRLPVKYGRYFEPFLGGGALFFHLQPHQAILADLNGDLLKTYVHVRDNLDEVNRVLSSYQWAHSKPHYYQTRELFNTRQFKNEAWLAATFIYLNKTCFNGLWRVNKQGEFNVPMGDYKNPKIYDPEALRACSNALQQTDLCWGDFETTVYDAEAGDFVYFDPPYVPLTKTSSFTAYTDHDFGLDKQAHLSTVARRLRARGVQVMLSNSDTPIVHDLYKDFQIDRVECPRAINANASRRGVVGEVIITSYLHG